MEGQEGTEQAALVSADRPSTPHLLIVAADGTWSSLPLPDDGVLTIGRGAEVDVRVNERVVSRKHARLEALGTGQFRVTDLGSANGTIVGCTMVRSADCSVEPGEPILIGRTVVTVHVPPVSAKGTSEIEAISDEVDTPVMRKVRAPVVREERSARGVAVTPAPSSQAPRQAQGSVPALSSRSPLSPRALSGMPALSPGAPAASPPSRRAQGTREPPGSVEPGAHGARIAPPARALAEVEALVAKAAPTMISVLLLGETGVGKDVIAERLHRQSTRGAGPLVRLNCAGLSAPLLESELFGHERGAFTGAAQSKQGLLEAAAGGTVFLDEVGEMPLEVQAKLLLAIEQRVARRLGSTRSEPIDVRFISATHRDIESEIRAGRFRADFYYRINGLTIRIPPLRQRKDELDALTAQFSAEAAARMGHAQPPLLRDDARALLHRHDWPGNIRELRHVVERAVLLADVDGVTPRVLVAAGLSNEQPARQPVAEAELVAALEREADRDPERARVVAALAECGGNQSRAARLLGISRNTLIARIRQYGLVRPHRPS